MTEAAEPKEQGEEVDPREAEISRHLAAGSRGLDVGVVSGHQLLSVVRSIENAFHVLTDGPRSEPAPAVAEEPEPAPAVAEEPDAERAE